MRIAFHAPLKPPTHPVPSGDRAMARLLMAAMTRAGHQVELAVRLRSRDAGGDPERQARFAAAGKRLADHLVRRYRGRPDGAPDAWFTYHLYYKAPDRVGPSVSAALGIPYIVAEASVAARRANGAWAGSHAAVTAALSQASLVLGLNSADHAGVAPYLSSPQRWQPLKPFVDDAPFAAAALERSRHRAALAAAHGLDTSVPWLIAVGMMRPGDKLASYRELAQSLRLIKDRAWRLLVVGDGIARPEVEAAIKEAATQRALFLGRCEPALLAGIYAAADLCVWPAVNEAFGMSLLEAQAAGLPVVAGRWGGVPDVVADGIAGRLVARHDVAAFAQAVAGFLDEPEARRAAGAAAAHRVTSQHGLAGAVTALDAALARLRR
ncbi:MAG: glycosyltransferase family 4 protein [Alphaproteobacteria bacterium]|nr:glycosyltransferase family 4 protein [Alphaproteobacteria bacterium]